MLPFELCAMLVVHSDSVELSGSIEVFVKRFVIAKLVLDSMQRILTCHVLVERPKQMHTKSIRTVYPKQNDHK